MGAFKKIFHPSAGGRQNPYSNPHHPNHDPKPAPPTDNSFPPRPTTAEPASPRGSFDYLAEARQAVGRDPVTGRHLHAASTPELHFDSPTYQRPPVRAVGGESSWTGATEVARSRGEISAFNSRNNGVRITSGTRYDLFVQEMKDRKMGGYRPPEGGYYAPPPKQATEFYAPAANWRAERGLPPMMAPMTAPLQQPAKRKSRWFGWRG
jgi:hypothetical protein